MLLHSKSWIFSLVCGENTDIIVVDEINYEIFIFSPFTFLQQYAGFLTIILVIEIAIAASMYAYKDHLADGLQKGLNNSIRNYGPDFVMKSADFDAMQENVSSENVLFQWESKFLFFLNCSQKISWGLISI